MLRLHRARASSSEFPCRQAGRTGKSPFSIGLIRRLGSNGFSVRVRQSVAIFLVRVLPRSAWSNLFKPQPLLKAWCDRALTNQWDKTGQQ